MAWALVLAILGKALGSKPEKGPKLDCNYIGLDSQPAGTTSTTPGLNRGQKSPSNEHNLSEPDDDVLEQALRATS